MSRTSPLIALGLRSGQGIQRCVLPQRDFRVVGYGPGTWLIPAESLWGGGLSSDSRLYSLLLAVHDEFAFSIYMTFRGDK